MKSVQSLYYKPSIASKGMWWSRGEKFVFDTNTQTINCCSFFSSYFARSYIILANLTSSAAYLLMALRWPLQPFASSALRVRLRAVPQSLEPTFLLIYSQSHWFRSLNITHLAIKSCERCAKFALFCTVTNCLTSLGNGWIPWERVGSAERRFQSNSNIDSTAQWFSLDSFTSLRLPSHSPLPAPTASRSPAYQSNQFDRPAFHFNCN